MTTDTMPASGLHAAMPMDAYRAITAINQTALKHILRSPLHCRYAIDHPEPPTPAQITGDAVHAAVLEPGRFAQQFKARPKIDRRTKAGKEAADQWDAENPGVTPIDDDTAACLTAMSRAVWEVPIARRLLSAPGQCELTAVWTDATTELACKGRFDRLTTLNGVPHIVELKTARSAAYSDFARDAARYGYHFQAAWYVDGHRHATGTDARHVFVVVENEPPHGVAVYVLNDAEMQSGRAQYRRALDQYAECVKSNQWPGYPASAQVLTLPHWALEEEIQ